MTAAVETRTFGVSSAGVSVIDGWVEEVATQWGDSKRTIFRTRLCIAELAANMLDHGSPRSGDDHIVVTLRHFGDGIEAELLDSDAPFDPTVEMAAAHAGSIESLPAGGRGLLLLRALCPDLWYCNDRTYNRVTLKHSG